MGNYDHKHAIDRLLLDALACGDLVPGVLEAVLDERRELIHKSASLNKDVAVLEKKIPPLMWDKLVAEMIAGIAVLILLIMLPVVFFRESAQVAPIRSQFDACYEMLVRERMLKPKVTTVFVPGLRCEDAGLQRLFNRAVIFVNANPSKEARWYSIRLVQGLPAVNNAGQRVVAPVVYYEANIERKP